MVVWEPPPRCFTGCQGGSKGASQGEVGGAGEEKVKQVRGKVKSVVVQVTAVQVESARQISWQAFGEGMSSEREVAKEGSQVKPAVRQEG